MPLIINIDVPDVAAAAAFYARAFGFERVRPLFAGKIMEMRCAGQLVHLLTKAEETPPGPSPASKRSYQRHWTPIHLDLVVDDLDVALRRALGAGAVRERPVTEHAWGRIAGVADPWGHGFCLIELSASGYDAVA